MAKRTALIPALRKEKMINGISVEDIYSDALGPVAILALEAFLQTTLTNAKAGEKCTRIELDMITFVAERAYGKAAQKLEVTHEDKQDSEVYLETVSTETLDAITTNVRLVK